MIHVLDLDGTVVPESSYMFLILFCASALFGTWFLAACMALLCAAMIPVTPIPLEDSEGVYVNTARPWPFVSPLTLRALSVPFDRVYFRSAWDTVESKLINMKRIQHREKKETSELTLYDNHRPNVDATRRAGFNAKLIVLN